MMSNNELDKLGIRMKHRIRDIVDYYALPAQQDFAQMALNSLMGFISLSTELKDHIHTIKSRIKDPQHLLDKLVRKALKAKKEKEAFDIDKKELFLSVNDLVGIRIIHLHTRQIEIIDQLLRQILSSQRVEVIEGPRARTWDHESEAYFRSIGIEVLPNENMYTSIHYIVKLSDQITCEIQVRTLMEEVWGEVDHSINYPHKSDSLSCREQLKALARVTSSCSRLVDSIFATYTDHNENRKQLVTT